MKNLIVANDLRDGTFNVKNYLQLDGQSPKYFTSEAKASPIEIFGASAIDYALGIMGTIGMVLLIAAAFRLLLARGDSTKIDEAKEMIKLVIFGIIIAFMAYIIVLSVQSIFPGK